MPTYKITAPDGTILHISGDSPPTEQELESLYAAATPALKQQPSESEAALSAFGGSLKAPFELAGAVGGAVTGTNPAPLAQMLQGIGQQSMGALRESVNPQLGTVERFGKLVESVPVAGPAITNLGQGLGGPLASALVEGKVATPQEEAGRGAAMGGLAGDLTLLGAGTAASKIGSALAGARASAGVRGAAKVAQAEHEAINAAIGMKERFVPGPGVPVDPATVVKAQGIKTTGEGVTTSFVNKQLQSRLEDLTQVKQQQLQAHAPITLDQAQVDRISDLLEPALRRLDRISKKAGDPVPDLRETVRDARITLSSPATVQAADLDALMHNLWEAQKNYLPGKKVRFLANRVKRAYGEFNANFSPEVHETNVNIRGIDAARDSSALKMRQEIASQGPYKAPPKTTAQRVKEYALPVAMGAGTTYAIRKLISDMFDKATSE